MALSPWHVASRISWEDISSLLAGINIPLARAGFVDPDAEEEAKHWMEVIFEAASRGELAPVAVEVREEVVQPDPDESDYRVIGHRWQSCDPSNLIWTFGYHLEDALRLTFERQEVYRWLKASGIADDDIPEALRVMPADRQQQSEELHPRREGTYQRIIATLLAVQYGANDLEEPYRLADQVLDDCQAQDVKAPASRNTLGDIFKQLPRVQKAPLD